MYDKNVQASISQINVERHICILRLLFLQIYVVQHKCCRATQNLCRATQIERLLSHKFCRTTQNLCRATQNSCFV
jgi:hypothetical protein